MLKINALFLIVLPLSLHGMEQTLPDLNNPFVLLECQLSEDIVKVLERKFVRVSRSADFSEIDRAFEDATALINNSSIYEYKDGAFLQNVKSVRKELFKKIIPQFPTLLAAINEQQGLADDFYPGQESENKVQNLDVSENAIRNGLKIQLEQERMALEARLRALEQKQKTDNDRKEQQIALLEKEVTNQRWVLNGFKIGTAAAAGVALYVVHRKANAVEASFTDNAKKVGFLEGSFKSLANTFESLRNAFSTNAKETDKRIKSLEDAVKAQAEINKNQAEMNKNQAGVNDSLQKGLKAVEDRPTIEIEEQSKSGRLHGHQIFIIDKDGKKEQVNGPVVFRNPPVQPKKRRK